MKNFLFLILSKLYGLGVWVRNMLYDEHILIVHHPKVATICVGNLAVGGTGKTPHVEYIVRLLSEQGYRVAILSRGYKRRTRGFFLATADTPASVIGDESRQMSLRFPWIPVAVCENRYWGIQRLLKLYPDLDAVVLDDAFQHRSIHCGYNILLTQSDRLYTSDHLLPYGRLRESAHGAYRADMIVVTKSSTSMRPIDRRIIVNAIHPAPYQDLEFSSMMPSSPVPLFPEVFAEQDTAALSLDDAPEGSIFLLAGIAQPQYMRASLGKRLGGEMIFPDHHAYLPQDMSALAEAYRQSGAQIILTTEKDGVRLRDGGLVPADLRPLIFCQSVEVSFDEGNVFDDRVLRYVSEHAHKHLKTQRKA